MTVILSWIIAALSGLCLYLLGLSSYQSWRRQLTTAALEECRGHLTVCATENRRLQAAITAHQAEMRKEPQVSSPPTP